MAGNRLDLHEIFINILGTKNQTISRVYFQPPSTVQLKYPCIIYKWDAQREVFANNRLYNNMKRYLVTVVDKDPDSTIPDKLMNLQYCSFVNHYVADNLNHNIFSIYF